MTEVGRVELKERWVGEEVVSEWNKLSHLDPR